jgi:subtilisin family serine protease
MSTQPDMRSSVNKNFTDPFEELRVGVTFNRPDGEHGPTHPGVHLSIQNIMEFVPEKQKMDQAINKLIELGFKLTGRGSLTASMKCTAENYKKTFNTSLKKIHLPAEENYSPYFFYFPPKGVRWTLPRTLKGLVDNVYIQWPHRFPSRRPASTEFGEDDIFTGSKIYTIPSARPPRVGYYHLIVPNQLSSLLKADKVHKHSTGTLGAGIRVVMIDSGFEHSHPFFCHHQYRSKVFLAGNAKNKMKDEFGHGTGQSANIFSVAPRVEFIGVKIGTRDNSNVKPASTLEGFCAAIREKPDIISISGGFDLRYKTSRKQYTRLPRSLKALEAEILHAVASGITVVVAAGNGEFSFPAMMPDVISVGGVFLNKKGVLRASNYASAYDSKIYPFRHVPDIGGLVGMQPRLQGEDSGSIMEKIPMDHYILLPVPPGSKIDKSLSIFKDGTKHGDGWASFSGTSAAAPQIAGVCALLKSKNRNLTPSEIKAILQKTAIKVSKGKSNQKSSEDGKTSQKGLRATGAGLVDAYRAWRAVEEG